MAISINWSTRIITVPKADTQLVSIGPPEIRQLDIDLFRKELNDLQAAQDGIPFLTTHTHNAPVTVGGVTLARVIELINGYTVTFEDGAYAVNLVGANSNIGDVVNLNQVSIRSNNSAGLTFSEQINDQSFLDARVYINQTSGLPGTNFPRGTPTDPVDNYVDAVTIATARKFSKFDVFGTTLSPTISDNLDRKHFIGHGSNNSIVTLNGGSSDSTIFENMSLTGTVNGSIDIYGSDIYDLIDFEGNIKNSGVEGDITLNSTCSGMISIINSYSQISGPGRPSLDSNGSSCDLSIRNYTGGLTIKNVTQNISASIDMNSGTLEIDSSCTNGTIIVRGICDLIDNSGVGCTVIRAGTVTDLIWNPQTSDYQVVGSTGEAVSSGGSLTVAQADIRFRCCQSTNNGINRTCC
jgi:hypothetical protein